MNLDKIININIRGRNVDNYLKRMIKRKINFIKVIPVNRKEVDIILKYSDYLELLKYKSVLYKVSIVEKMGILKLKDKLEVNKVLILFVILGLVLLYSLSNMVFNVEVIHQDKNIRELVYDELEDYGITKFSFKKSYAELEEIEDKILEDNKDKLEWLEIVIEGTFVTVRVEERLINIEEDGYQHQSIVSKKNAVITEINARGGEVVKEEGVYVKKGDVIISGAITHPDNSRSLTMAEGVVYGEVWYEVDIDYPFVYQESNLTGNSKTGLVIKFFNKEIALFGKEKYRSFSSKNKVLFSDNFLNLEIIKEKRYELDIKDEVYTEELVQSRAITYIKEKMMKDNLDIKEISKVEVMSRDIDYDGIRFKFFVTTVEEIGEVVLIEEELELETED